MAKEFLAVEFGVLDDPIMRFRNTFGTGKGNRGAFLSPRDPVNIARMEVTVHEIALRLEEAIKREFEPHNDTGETIKTLHVEGHGLTLRVVMEGGAIYVEYGTAPHVIKADKAPFLYWEDMDYPFGVTEVQHPGYTGDDFLGRAMREVELETALRQLAHGILVDVMGYAESSRGVQYAAGQQFEREL